MNPEFETALNEVMALAVKEPTNRLLHLVYKIQKLVPHKEIGEVHWVIEDLIDDIRAYGESEIPNQVVADDLVDLAGHLSGNL